MGLKEQFQKFKDLFRREKKELEKEPEREMPFDPRPILKDNKDEDLVCSLCENWDNEYNAYYPIHEGEKKIFMGKPWHIKCYRAFVKEAKRGSLA